MSITTGEYPLELMYVSAFEWIWNDRETGAMFDGSIFKPRTPPGFHVLGYLAFGPAAYPTIDDVNRRVVLVARDREPNAPKPALKPPVDYELIGNDRKSGGKYDCSWWRAVPPQGYVALGTVFVSGHVKPALGAIMCVRADLAAVQIRSGKLHWADRGSGAKHDVTLFDIRPHPSSPGLDVGATLAVPKYVRGEPPLYYDWVAPKIYTLRAGQRSTPPPLSRSEIEGIIARRGPILHFHPDEKYYTMTTAAFLADSYEVDRDHLNVRTPATLLGDIQRSTAYVAVRGVHPQFTDLEFWFFYGQKGSTFLRTEEWPGNDSKNTEVLKNGTHVGDWQHVVLRVDNTLKDVVAVGYSSHGHVDWYRPHWEHIHVFSALHMHDCYPVPGTHLELAAWKRGGDREVKIYCRYLCGDGKAFEAFRNYQFVVSDLFEIETPEWAKRKIRWGPKLNPKDKIRIYGSSYPYEGDDEGPETPDFGPRQGKVAPSVESSVPK